MPNVLLLSLVVIAIIGFFYLTRHRSNVVERRQKLAASRAGKYAAVSIRTSRNGCPAAERIKDQRYLSNEAPLLPLANCTWAKCHCTYVHHPDRRTGSGDRRGQQTLYPGKERRDTRGRRASDLVMAATPAG